jgi:hypothetical protein
VTANGEYTKKDYSMEDDTDFIPFPKRLRSKLEADDLVALTELNEETLLMQHLTLSGYHSFCDKL